MVSVGNEFLVTFPYGCGAITIEQPRFISFSPLSRPNSICFGYGGGLCAYQVVLHCKHGGARSENPRSSRERGGSHSLLASAVGLQLGAFSCQER